MRNLLEISYAYVQWFMYRPFLQYVSRGFQSRSIDGRSHTCAARCVDASQTIVRITADMHNKGLLNGSYWFATHAVYFSIITLLFLVLEGPNLPRTDEALRHALIGTQTLERLSKDSLFLEICTRVKVRPRPVHDAVSR